MKESSYIRWYKKEQSKFQNYLSSISPELLVSRQTAIRAQARRLGMLSYCREHGFILEPTEASTATAENQNLFTRILNWIKSKVSRSSSMATSRVEA